MEKKLIRINVGEEKEFDAESYTTDHSDINEVIDYFIKAKEAGATHIDWYAECDRDGFCELCKAQPFCERKETDDEAKERLKKEAAKLKAKQEYSRRNDREEYNRLKAIFENNNL